MPKTVLVTGDVVIDHHLYRGIRATPDSRDSLGTMLKKERGGAWLLAELLRHVATPQRSPKPKRGARAKHAKESPPFTVHFGLSPTALRALPPSAEAYAVWEAFGEGDQRVWRVTQALGYGRFDNHKRGVGAFKVADLANPSIVVLDDGGLSFRSSLHETAWPKAIRQQKKAAVDWIVLKMARPLFRGDLWRRVTGRFLDRLVVIVGIDDLRREEVRVSKGVSWERTATELRQELESNPSARELLKCRHLVVNLGAQGSLWVADAAGAKPTFHLTFDPGAMEGDLSSQSSSAAFGSLSCLAAGIVHQLAVNSSRPDIETGIRRGLAGIRELVAVGHGRVSLAKPGFPYDAVARALVDGGKQFSTVQLPRLKKDTVSRWMIVEAHHGNTRSPLPLYGLARQMALLGPRAVLNVPYASFGKLFTVDRAEIEALRTIRQLIIDYAADRADTKPLSIGVFGPPGAGKSFGIKEIARGVLGSDVPLLEFNLSQFPEPGMLGGAFHQIRDRALEGKIPVAFWDEFDSGEYFWLQYLLAPMQDGKFQEGQITHPIGKAVFVFAGATSYDLAHFGPPKGDKAKEEEFKLHKGPDFISRLSGYLNVLGPNRRKIYSDARKRWVDDPTDICFPLRRAILLRAGFGLSKHKLLDIDRGLLSALLEVGEYRYGARSLASIANHLRVHGLQRSGLPAPEILSMHLKEEEFMRIANRDVPFQATADDLAPAIHETYRSLSKKEGWTFKYDMAYEDLPDDIKADNREAAARIPRVLDLVDLYVAPKSGAGDRTLPAVPAIIERNLELLAQAEHDGWMEVKLRNGWVAGTPRDDDQKIHPALVPYAELSEVDRKKDRNSVRTYPKIVDRAGFKIVGGQSNRT